MKKHLLLLLLFILTVSCKNTDTGLQTFQPIDSVSIKAVKSTEFTRLNILLPDQMLYANGNLILSQNNVDNDIIKVFNAKTLENIASCGRIGEAHNEILSLGNIDFSMVNGQLSIGLVDYDNAAYHSYSLDDSTHHGVVFKSDKDCNNILKLQNDKILISTLYDSTKFLLYDNNVLIDSLALFPPKPTSDIPLLVHSLACSAWQSTNPNKNLTVASYFYDGGIDVIEMQENKLSHKWSFRIFNMDYNIDKSQGIALPMPSKKSRYGYTYTSISDKYIYALFSGKLLSDDNTASSNIIHIFDYDGKNIRKITLDKTVTDICVDNNDDILYAISLDSEGNHILVEYALPKY